LSESWNQETDNHFLIIDLHKQGRQDLSVNVYLGSNPETRDFLGPENENPT